MTYLDALLNELPDGDLPPPPSAPVVEQPRVVEAASVIEMPAPAAPAPIETRVEAPVTAAGVTPPPEEIGAPEWGRGRFHCLLFHVNGLKLAVPLIKLNGIVPWSDEITPMPGRKVWNLGVLRHLDYSVKVVDTARIVMPEDRLPEIAEKPHQIILIDNYRWGLACGGVEEMISLHSEAVRWRTSRTRRPWLAGTVIQHMCAILDVDALAATLASGDWSIEIPQVDRALES